VPKQTKFSILLLLTAAICFLAIYIHRHRQGQTTRVDNALINASGYLQRQFFYMGNGARLLIDRYLWLVNTRKENVQLEKELGYLRTRLSALLEVEAENLRLRQALQFRSHVEPDLVAAHVVAHDVSTDYFGIRIDRGSRHGVQVGMGVVSSSGLGGRVLRVALNYSDVLTLLDPTSNIDAVIQRSRARGILSGQSKQLLCRLKYLDKLEDVAVNDTVVASGYGGIFPKGLLVGHVTAVIPNPNGPLQTVIVKSAVDIHKLEEVFIVLPSTESDKTS